MRDYSDYVQAILSAYRAAADLSPPPVPHNRPATEERSVLICSPHPDDEIIVGALPLRLQREGLRVINLCVTLGSNKERQLERLSEAKDACSFAGFELMELAERGLEGITPDCAELFPAQWNAAVEAVAEAICETRPVAVLYPHAADANRTHIGVHRLLLDALPLAGLECHCFQTEFWAPMQKPNLMVEITPEEVATLVAALSLHRGEVARNPYHLRLPMWMMDNVRRGAELVGGQGAAAPSFSFATLYRHSIFSGSRMEYNCAEGCFLASGENAKALLF